VRSIFAKILLWSFATLVVSLLAFVVISVNVSSGTVRRGERFGHFAARQLADAREAYESGGPQKLAAYLDRLNHYFPAEHYFTDASGKDLVSGADRSALLAKATSSWRLRRLGGEHFVTARPSSDGKYRLIVAGRPPVDIWSLAPYYLLILAAVVLLCYLLAVNIASPLKLLGRTVELFGAGDLSARVRSKRNDEIGDLSHAFDQMAERIQTLLTAERRLLQDISHELRSPLARLSFAVELTRTADNREAAVLRLKKELQRLNDLVDGLLHVTRVEGDPSSHVVENFALDALLEELAGDSWIEADACNSRVQLSIGQPVTIRGDRELLHRAIENVLRNAIRHAPDGTPVEVALEASARFALICIRDYGPGVPENLLPEIFKPFFRVDTARNSANGGVGLGLAIAHRAVTLHHGRMWAQNMGPGLMVSIELPLESAANGVAHKLQGSAPA